MDCQIYLHRVGCPNYHRCCLCPGTTQTADRLAGRSLSSAAAVVAAAAGIVPVDFSSSSTDRECS